jgi:putative transposase
LKYTGTGIPEHNAYIERFFRTLKEEEIWPNFYETIEEAKDQIEDYIEFYNTERQHSSPGYVSPAEFLNRAALDNAA